MRERGRSLLKPTDAYIERPFFHLYYQADVLESSRGDAERHGCISGGRRESERAGRGVNLVRIRTRSTVGFLYHKSWQVPLILPHTEHINQLYDGKNLSEGPLVRVDFNL